jgi:hypothetical protein
MNARAKHLLDEAMTLTTAERASKLLASLDGEAEEGAEEGAEEAWAEESRSVRSPRLPVRA